MEEEDKENNTTVNPKNALSCLQMGPPSFTQCVLRASSNPLCAAAAATRRTAVWREQQQASNNSRGHLGLPAARTVPDTLPADTQSLRPAATHTRCVCTLTTLSPVQVGKKQLSSAPQATRRVAATHTVCAHATSDRRQDRHTSTQHQHTHTHTSTPARRTGEAYQSDIDSGKAGNRKQAVEGRLRGARCCPAPPAAAVQQVSQQNTLHRSTDDTARPPVALPCCLCAHTRPSCQLSRTAVSSTVCAINAD